MFKSPADDLRVEVAGVSVVLGGAISFVENDEEHNFLPLPLVTRWNVDGGVMSAATWLLLLLLLMEIPKNDSIVCLQDEKRMVDKMIE